MSAYSFLTRFLAALAVLDRSACENAIHTCMHTVTRARPIVVKQTPFHVERSWLHLKNLNVA